MRSGDASNTSSIRNSSNLRRLETIFAMTRSPGRAPSTKRVFPSSRAIPRPSWLRVSMKHGKGSLGSAFLRLRLINCSLTQSGSGAGKYASGQIPITAITDNGYDYGVFNLPGDLKGCSDGTARRDATEDTFFPGEGPHGVFRILLADVHDLVDPARIEDARQVFLRPTADSRNG